MRISLILLCLSLISCAQNSPSKEKIQASYHLDIGTTHLTKGNLPRAIGELVQAERLDPDNPAIQNNLGVAYFAREKYDMAFERFQKAVKLKPSYTDARNNLAGLYIETGKYKEALVELETCLKDLTYQNPEKIHMNLGITYFRLKNYPEALVNLKKTLEYKREHCLAMNYYGRTQYELKEFKLAAQSLDQAVYYCRETKFDEPYYFSGLSFLRMGNRERAEARFNELVKLYPSGKFVSKAQELLEGLK
jgi:Tfp pilus assembly protein PilF